MSILIKIDICAGYNRPLKMFQKLPLSAPTVLFREPTASAEGDSAPVHSAVPVKDMNEQRKRPPPAYVQAPVEKRMRPNE